MVSVQEKRPPVSSAKEKTVRKSELKWLIFRKSKGRKTHSTETHREEFRAECAQRSAGDWGETVHCGFFCWSNEEEN
jgi:hypothetical protein